MDDKIIVAVKLLLKLIIFLEANLKKIAAIIPESEDNLVGIFNEFKKKQTFIGSKDAEKYSNQQLIIRLETRQLIYGKGYRLRQCKICHCYLLQYFLGNSFNELISSFEVFNSKGIELQFCNLLENLEKKAIDHLFSGEISIDECVARAKKVSKDPEQCLKLDELEANLYKESMKKYDQLDQTKKKSTFQTYQKDFKNYLKVLKKTLENKIVEIIEYESDMNEIKEIFQRIMGMLPQKANKGNNENFLDESLDELDNQNQDQSREKIEIAIDFEKHWEQKKLNFYKICSNCYYGCANSGNFEQQFSSNQKTIMSKIWSSLNQQSSSIELRQNITDILPKNENNFSCYSGYPYGLLKKKEIINWVNEEEIFNDHFSLNKKNQLASKKIFTSRTKNQLFYYFINEDRSPSILVNIGYVQQEQLIKSWIACGGKKKLNGTQLAIIVDSFYIKENDLINLTLNMNKASSTSTKNQENTQQNEQADDDCNSDNEENNNNDDVKKSKSEKKETKYQVKSNEKKMGLYSYFDIKNFTNFLMLLQKNYMVFQLSQDIQNKK